MNEWRTLIGRCGGVTVTVMVRVTVRVSDGVSVSGIANPDLCGGIRIRIRVRVR